MDRADGLQILVAQRHAQQGGAHIEPGLQAFGMAAKTGQRNDQRQRHAQQKTLEKERPKKPRSQNAVQPAVQKAQHQTEQQRAKGRHQLTEQHGSPPPFGEKAGFPAVPCRSWGPFRTDRGAF